MRAVKEIQGLQVAANDVLNWLLQNRSKRLNKEESYVMSMFRQQLLKTYEILPVGSKGQTVKLKQYRVPTEKKYLAIYELQQQFQELRNYFKAVIIHGSLADGYVVDNWSDVDILAIVKDDVFESTEKFVTLRKKLLSLEEGLYKYDPWQHHGVQYISESDLGFYPEYFLPINVIKEGRLLVGQSRLVFNLRGSAEEQSARLYAIKDLFMESAKNGEMKHHARDGKYLQEDFRMAKDNFYQFKYFISLILLMPSLFIALVDKPIDKRKSFEVIKNYFSEGDLELIRAGEEARSLAPDFHIKNNEIPLIVQETLGGGYFKRASKILNLFVKEYELRKSA
ncbi:MAG: hypothetical protein Q8P73_01235 [bacterium]|nr:hypothetical protein [bacterium]